MNAILRFLDPERVLRRHRLEGADRELLDRRYRDFKHRVAIELRRMDELSLESLVEDGVEHHAYEGPWFTVRSTADEEMTRRCIVRIDQMVRAYRQLLPPRRRGSGFRILLFGSMDEYRGYLQRLGLKIDNPAFYSASQNLIVAGSNLSRYAEQLQLVRSRNAAVLRRYDQVLNPAFDRVLEERGRELQQGGSGSEEIALRRAAWENQYTALQRRIAEINRRNEAKFADVTRQMFKRLYHEAFHAYLENHVYPQHSADVPRWLNEGLAQVFEGSLFDADTLRADAPDPARWAALRKSLDRHPLRLTQLLRETRGNPADVHGAAYSPDHYLYAWGLAYYLSFHANLLAPGRLDTYVSPKAARLDPIPRFEQLVGMPLPEFETQWRTAVREQTFPVRGNP
jgi:hypothetical protein